MNTLTATTNGSGERPRSSAIATAIGASTRAEALLVMSSVNKLVRR